jgi:choline dehydrogenase-like flavoprotein
MNPPRFSDAAVLNKPHSIDMDAVVVGSGPGGATVARTLSRGGWSVAVLEEGPAVTSEMLGRDAFTAMASLYRGLGATVALGRAGMPLVQGRALGGTSVVNGAICWRLPRDVHAGWVTEDPVLETALPWDDIEAATDAIEQDLHIAPTDDTIAGAHNHLLARGAHALGLEHRPIRRNTRNCRGLGRCLQGCPLGNKLSMDRSYLADAAESGAQLWCNLRVGRILVEKGRATGVLAHNAAGIPVTVRARRAVVLAAGAIESPQLLLRSGLSQGPVGRGLMCHPGVSVNGVFPEDVSMWTGATQGHEVIGLRQEGLKFEALGYDLALVASRVKGVGQRFSDEILAMKHVAQWGCAVRAVTRGRVRNMPWGPLITYALGDNDMLRVRRGVAVLCRLMLAAGATRVDTGIHGQPPVHSTSDADQLEAHASLDPRHYEMAATHLFGTCRLGSNPATSVVRPDFRHHHVRGLHVACASTFPSNTGVNPQTSIMALASLCARRMLQDA